jgi:hypothetical protein
MPMRPKFIVLLGLLASAASSGAAPVASAAGPNIAQSTRVLGLAVRVDERSDALCREESRVLASLKKEGASARRAIEAFGHVARCENVRADIAVTLAEMSAAANAERKRESDSPAKGIGRATGRPADDKSADGRQGNEAKPGGQLRDDAADVDKRRAAEDADKLRRAEEDKRRAEDEDRARRAAEVERDRKVEAERRRKAEEAEERREAAEARRAKERREAARRKTEMKKVEIKRKPPSTKTSSRGGVYARCEAAIAAKYMLLDPRERAIRLTQCLANGGTVY